MSEDEMLKALLELTTLRREGVDEDLMSFLRRSLKPESKQITWQELNQKERELEDKLSRWWVVWNDANRSYGIVPRE